MHSYSESRRNFLSISAHHIFLLQFGDMRKPGCKFRVKEAENSIKISLKKCLKTGFYLTENFEK